MPEDKNSRFGLDPNEKRCVELVREYQNGNEEAFEHIVKNNIIIGKEYKAIIITGPNTGGKTVLLKTLGLLSLMVKDLNQQLPLKGFSHLPCTLH